jgi:hypothetical protein
LAVVLGALALHSATTALAARVGLVHIGGGSSVSARLGASLARAAAPLLRSPSPWRPLRLGVVLGALPCMIVVWALGLAALTASPLWGALLMLTLVAMTTPFILAIGAASRLFARPSRARQGITAALLALSGLWLMLVGAAGFGLVPHQHVSVGAGYMIMLW